MARRKNLTIPDDLHLEVLKFLPSKTLLRFSCVSKSWNFTIHNPNFAHLHRTISQTRLDATVTSVVLSADHSQGRKFYFFNINQQREAIHQLTLDTSDFGNLIVNQVVNGLICLHYKGDSFVFNITTRDFVSLPTQPCIYVGAPNYILGYDSLNNEYKVLCFWRGGCKCMVFTIGKNKEWREVIDPLDSTLYPHFFFNNAVHHEGDICWLAWPDRTEVEKLVAFDIREEKFRIISLPVMPEPEHGDRRIKLQLLKIGGCIALCAAMGGSNLFILEDYTNQVWVKRNIQVPEYFAFIIGSVEKKVIFQSGDCKDFSFDPNNGEVLPFEISGLDHLIEDSEGRRVFRAKVSICEIVENIYPLRQN